MHPDLRRAGLVEDEVRVLNNEAVVLLLEPLVSRPGAAAWELAQGLDAIQNPLDHRHSATRRVAGDFVVDLEKIAFGQPKNANSMCHCRRR